jgi:uncharacterized integral membrane protein
MRIVVTVLILAVAIALTIFSAQNISPVQLRFVTYRSDTFPLSLVIVLSAIAGAALMGLFWMQDMIRRGLRFRSEHKARSSAEKKILDLELQLAKLSEEYNALKSPPQPAAGAQPAAGSQENQVGV